MGEAQLEKETEWKCFPGPNTKGVNCQVGSQSCQQHWAGLQIRWYVSGCFARSACGKRCKDGHGKSPGNGARSEGMSEMGKKMQPEIATSPLSPVQHACMGLGHMASLWLPASHCMPPAAHPTHIQKQGARQSGTRFTASWAGHQIPQDTTIHRAWYNQTPHPYLAHRLSQGGPRWKKGAKPLHKHHQRSSGQGFLQPFIALFGIILVILVLRSIFRIARAVKKILEPPRKWRRKGGRVDLR